ncbi:T9SS type A sorting domain-containing protein [Saccharicrinis sp. FJH62]|uniref:T9SS type A sorting domain-containing protein n=1 Tax=Saccharicrinis sp. FJH62 TaxID=3344657 RepID=UPI0035D405A0
MDSYYVWDSMKDIWSGVYKSEYVFDENGLIISGLSYDWNTNENDWTTGTKSDWFYSLKETTRLNNREFTPLNFYPNPAHDEIQLNLKGDSGLLSIYNLSGKRLSQNAYFGSNPNIDISNLTKGVYIIEIVQDGKLVRSKFVKK